MVPVDNDENNHADHHDGTPTAHEAGLAARRETVVNVLDAAEQRDIEADARDRASVERDHADLEALMTPDVNNGYGADLPARRHAAQDRDDAKGHRASAADDRAVLGDAVKDSEASHESDQTDDTDETTERPLLRSRPLEGRRPRRRNP